MEKSFWFLLCHFDFKFVAFDFSKTIFHFQSLSRLISQIAFLISKIWRVWFLKWQFWFPKLDAFDFSNDTFDFQNLTRLISQIPKFDAFWFLKWHFWFPKFQVGVAHLFDEFTLDLLFFCSLLVFGCQVRPRNWWKWYVLLWNLVTIMYVYCSMFHVRLQLFDTSKIRVRKETLFTTN